MAEQTSDSTYRISGLYVTPNWNGNSDRVAMSCGIGATIKVLRKVDVVIAADPGATLPKTWNMTARNTILRTTNKVYLYARVERNGANGMYIWSENFYDVTGVAGDKVAVNNEQYYYIRVGELGAVNGATRPDFKLDYGQYGVNADGTDPVTPKYNWDDLMYFDPVNKVIVFLYNLATIAFNSIVLAGKELGRVLTGKDVEYDKDSGKYTLSEGAESDGAVVTGGFLKEWVNIITGKFLRKDKDDETAHQLTMQKAVVRSAIETQGYNGKDSIDGTGAAMWEVDERGEKIGHVVTDYLTVRRAATFRNLSIIEVNHMGGEFIISAADCDIAYVDPLDADGNLCQVADAVRFRCYFEKEANGRVVYNEWKRHDQAYCRRFNVAEKSEVDGSFYWRMVLDVHNATEEETFHWIDLSNILDDEVPQVALDSNTPKADDKIVVFGHQCHRDNPGEHFYDRTCAQMYSTVGINAPSRDYYYGIGTLTDKDGNITPFSLPSSSMEGVGRNDNDGVYWHVGDNKHYMNYSTEKGLDIRTSSMTVIAGGKDVSVGEALGENFNFYNTEDEAPRTNGKVAEWIPEDGINPSREEWLDSEYPDHVGDYLITSDGFTYEFVNDSEQGYGWVISSDQHLVHAQETADAAVKNLDDMASDDVITPQEKCQLRDEMSRAESDVEKLLEEATDTGLTVSQKESLELWFKAFRTFANFVLENMDVSTELVNTLGYLTVYMSTKLSVPKIVRVSSYDNMLDSTPVGGHYTFRQTYAQFYEWFGVVRSSITRTILSTVRDILAGDITINEVVNARVDALHDEVAKNSQTVSSLDKEVTALANNVVYTDPVTGEQWDMFKGFLAADNFSSLFAYAYNDKGEMVVSSKVSTFVKKGADGKLESGVSISADKIDFEAADITMFSQNFRIDADNFKVNDQGVYIRGEIHATSGTFDGTVKATKGFCQGFRIVQLKRELDENGQWVYSGAALDSGDCVVVVDYSGDGEPTGGVILPIKPNEGQNIRVISNMNWPLLIQSSQGIRKPTGTYNSVTVKAHSVTELVYGTGTWYLISNNYID